MESYSSQDVLSFLCKNSEKWGILIIINDNTKEEYIHSSLPWFSFDRHFSLLDTGVGFLLLSSEEEAEDIFNESRACDGVSRCIVCNNEGKLILDSEDFILNLVL